MCFSDASASDNQAKMEILIMIFIDKHAIFWIDKKKERRRMAGRSAVRGRWMVHITGGLYLCSGVLVSSFLTSSLHHTSS